MLESLSNKVADLNAGNFIIKKLQHRCFPVNIAKFLRTTLLFLSVCYEVLFSYWASADILFLIKNTMWVGFY